MFDHRLLSVRSAFCLVAFAGGLAVSAAQGQITEDLLLGPQDLVPSAEFGSSVDTDGVALAVGSSGRVYVFNTFDGVQQLALEAPPDSGGFGADVAICAGHLAVGSPSALGGSGATGAVYLYDTTTGALLHKLEVPGASAGDQVGFAVAIDGEHVVVGARNGAFVFNALTGAMEHELLPVGGLPVGGTGIIQIEGGFGQAVDIDGDRIVVGAKVANGAAVLSGAVYVFDTEGQPLQVLNAGGANEQFGGSVGVDGTRVIVGSKYASPNGKDSGQAYLFDGESGTLLETIAPSDGHLFAHFGSSVAIDGLLLAIGAEQDNQSSFAAGAVYLYDTAASGLLAKLGASDAAPGDELGAAVAAANGVVLAGASAKDGVGLHTGAAYVFSAAGTVTDFPGCFGNLGELALSGGLPVAGQSLEFTVSQAQPGTSLVLLVAAGAPALVGSPCGVALEGIGELLVDLSGASTLLVDLAAWSDPSAEFSAQVPLTEGLAGFEFFVQCATIAPSASEAVRLTNGLELVLGGFL